MPLCDHGTQVAPGDPCGSSLGGPADDGAVVGSHLGSVEGSLGWGAPGWWRGSDAVGGDTVECSLHRWFCLRIRLFPTLLSVATQSYQWYSWGPPNMQCRLCASCWTYWKKYGGLKMPTRLDGERPGPNRNNMVSGTHPLACRTSVTVCVPLVMALCWGGAPPSAESPRCPSPEQWEPQVCHEDEAGILPAHHQADAHRPAPVPRDPAPLACCAAPLHAHQQRSNQGRV